jgi:hypothetical protein
MKEVEGLRRQRDRLFLPPKTTLPAIQSILSKDVNLTLKRALLVFGFSLDPRDLWM